MPEEKEKFEYREGRIRRIRGQPQPFELAPRACWELSEDLRQFLIAHASEFEQPPIKTVGKNEQRFDVLVTQNLRFWEDVENGRWEPHTFRIFDSFLTPEHVYVDIGTWIGPTLLYASQLAGKAYGLEPDPVAFAELERNLNANRAAAWMERVEILQQAITTGGGTVRLGNRAQAGNSQSSLLFHNEISSWTVDSITFRRFIDSEALRDKKLFIKMDIEGAEYDLLPTLKDLLKELDVTLYLSLHPHLLSAAGHPASRIRFALRHLRLLRSLPFQFFYHKSGHRLKPWKQVMKALLKKTFLQEIVATNQTWRKE